MRRVRGFLAALVIACVAALSGSATAFGATATYTATETIPVPPASNFQGSAGGDGWAVALSSTQVFNVFHHDTQLEVACHNQSDASACWPTASETITDGSGNGFATSGQPGLYLDQASGKLYVFATRSSDDTGGVVCIDTTQAATNPDPFCGFTALTPVGDAPLGSEYSTSRISGPMRIGNDWYAFNYVDGAGQTGAQNSLLCFDVSTHAPCAGQPFAVTLGTGTASLQSWPAEPPTAAIGDHLIIPINWGGTDELACFDATSQANCAGSWPVATGVPTSGLSAPGAAFPLLDATGEITGLCLPTGTDPCFTLDGASTPTPAGMPSVIGDSDPWNGPAMVLGPRVYVPNGAYNGDAGSVQCFDYSTGAGCANFPKTFNDLSYLYTVNPDPARPTCIWVNSDSGDLQIQNFDAYTGGACGQGSIRVLASQFVVNAPQCVPASYTNIQILQPTPGQYSPTTSTLALDDGDGNPITTITPNPQSLTATGSVSLVGMGLNTATGLPQFLFTLNGLTGQPGSVQVQLTWTGNYDQSCVGPNTTVTGADNDLGIANVPANITTDATKPGGAVVSYALPTATDESGDDPSASVSCAPASGSTFSIGTTTVTCTATDADDSNGPVSASFTVTVKGALSQLQELKAYVTGLAPGTSLPTKVQAAITTDQAGDIADTCSELTALINEAKAQSGKALTSAQASTIINDADRVRAVLGC